MELKGLIDEINKEQDVVIRNSLIKLVKGFEENEGISKEDLTRLVRSMLNRNKKYTVNDIIAMYKSKKSPNGVSKQYIAKEIRKGNLVAEKIAGSYLVSQMELERYFSKKNIFLQK